MLLCIIVGPRGEGVSGCVLTCLGLCRTSCVVAVARMALLLPGLSCRLMDSPLTSCTPNSAMVTFSSTTVMVFSARIESDNGDSTYGTEKRKKDETLMDLNIPFKQMSLPGNDSRRVG